MESKDLTEEEKEKHRLIALVYSLFHQICIIEDCQSWIATVHKKYKDNPHFKKAIQELDLSYKINKYLA